MRHFEKQTALLLGVMCCLTASCTPDFPDNKDLTPVIEKFNAPRGNLDHITSSEFANLFIDQRDDAIDASDPMLTATDSVDDSITGIELPGRGFLQIIYQCDETEQGQGILIGSVIVEGNTAQTTVGFRAKKCDLGGYWFDGSFDIDFDNEHWLVASLDLSTRSGVDAGLTTFVGALRVCRGGDAVCNKGDIELSIDIANEENIVVVFSAAEGVIGVRDISGSWTCRASPESEQDAHCAREALSFNLLGVNP